jgi:hypothetical protein
MRWLAFAGSSADLDRLRLFKLRSSPSAKRMAQAFDQLRPRWLERLRRQALAEDSDVVQQVVGTALDLGGPEFPAGKPSSERIDEALRRIEEADAASTRPESRSN